MGGMPWGAKATWLTTRVWPFTRAEGDVARTPVAVDGVEEVLDVGRRVEEDNEYAGIEDGKSAWELCGVKRDAYRLLPGASALQDPRRFFRPPK